MESENKVIVIRGWDLNIIMHVCIKALHSILPISTFLCYCVLVKSKLKLQNTCTYHHINNCPLPLVGKCVAF